MPANEIMATLAQKIRPDAASKESLPTRTNNPNHANAATRTNNPNHANAATRNKENGRLNCSIKCTSQIGVKPHRQKMVKEKALPAELNKMEDQNCPPQMKWKHQNCRRIKQKIQNADDATSN
jgi:hypothetical protein